MRMLLAAGAEAPAVARRACAFRLVTSASKFTPNGKNHPCVFNAFEDAAEDDHSEGNGEDGGFLNKWTKQPVDFQDYANADKLADIEKRLSAHGDKKKKLSMPDPITF